MAIIECLQRSLQGFCSSENCNLRPNLNYYDPGMREGKRDRWFLTKGNGWLTAATRKNENYSPLKRGKEGEAFEGLSWSKRKSIRDNPRRLAPPPFLRGIFRGAAHAALARRHEA